MTLLFTVAMNTLWYVLVFLPESYFRRIFLHGITNVQGCISNECFVSLRRKEQVIRLTNGMKGIKKGSYVIHLKLM
jgi:hypothetical protein